MYFLTLRGRSLANEIRRHDRTTTRLRFFSGIDKVVENQINSWLRKGGEDDLQNKGKSLIGGDRDRHMANALGVGHDYVHSKILADNNIKPESIQRRLDLDRGWTKLRGEIRTAYRDRGDGRSVEEFAESSVARELFDDPIQELDRQAKGVNVAIVSDSLRFNGRSPVPHARRFRLQERILEALTVND